MGAILFLAALVVQSLEPLHWPLALPRVLTSSFGEYRAGRFHLGIDLRTGPVGKPVSAAGQGHVSRVVCSPYGYGKAVYLQLDDGHTVVYAHLSAFAPPLLEYVRAAQHQRERYTVDLYPRPGQFPVAAGDLIAKSGQTGVGVPHLHYEIRDSAGAPINPRTLGISWPDTTAPRFRKAVVLPASPESTLNGDLMPVVLKARSLGEGRFETDALRVTGPVAFGVDVVDPANGGSTRLGIHTMLTKAAGDELFLLRHDRIGYDTAHHGAVAYHPFLLDRGRFLLQWRWPGNETEMYRAHPSNGVLAPAEEPVDVTFEAVDALGNSVLLTIPLLPGSEGEPVPPEGPGTGRGVVTLDTFGQWIVVSVRFTKPEPEPPLLRVDRPAPEQRVFRRVHRRLFRCAYIPLAGADQNVFRITHPRVKEEARSVFASHRDGPGQTAVLDGEDGAGIELFVKPGSPFGTLLWSMEAIAAKGTAELRPHGPAYRIWPAAAPIDEPIEIVIRIPNSVEERSRLGVYRATAKGWNYEGGVRQGNRLRVTLRNLGTFALMEDLKPPRLRPLEPAHGSATDKRRPRIRAAVVDKGSGIQSFSIHSNGKWLLAEYDPERSLLVWESDEDLPEGVNELTFRAADRAGHIATRAVTVTVSP